MKTTKNKIVYEENINCEKGKALAIVFPESIQEIKNLVKLSNHDLIPRGSGSSMTGAVHPKNSVIVDFSKMNEIIDINPGKRTVIVEPGVLLSDLNEELEPYGLEFPINPVFGEIETIGGILAKNSSGNREIKYNRVINWVNSLEIINNKGEQIRISKSDLSDFIGMEGTTGLIIKATLRLTNKKERTLTILKANTLEDVFNAGKRLKLDLDVSAIDVFSKEVSSAMGLANIYHIFVEFENEKGTFKGENYEKYVKLKDNVYKKMASEGFTRIEDVKFLFDSLQDFMIYLEGKKIPYFCHLASGVIYPLFKNNEQERLNPEEFIKLIKRLRGRAGYALGTGAIKKQFLEFGEAELFRRVKKRLDPNNNFNREKLVSFSPPEEVREEAKEELVAIEEKKEEIKNETLSKEEKPEEKIGQEIQESKSSLRVADLIATGEIPTLENHSKAETSEEEKEKIKKIAAGFFAGGRDIKQEGENH